MPGAPQSINQIVSDLQRLGLAPGDVVMVHASLRAIGPVDDGAAGVVRALDAALGPTGTSLMVLGAHDDWSWVNERPENEREALLADADPFDAATTPAQKDVGTLAEIFRTTAGTVVSNHPEGRFGARGRLAESLLSNVPWNDYYGPGSPLERFVEANGKVLRLGADENTVTLTHYAEYLADIPEKRRVQRHRRVRAREGLATLVVECLDDEHGVVGYEGEDYFGVILREYFQRHDVPRGLVGRATSELIDARPFLTFATAWMTANLGRPGR